MARWTSTLDATSRVEAESAHFEIEVPMKPVLTLALGALLAVAAAHAQSPTNEDTATAESKPASTSDASSSSQPATASTEQPTSAVQQPAEAPIDPSNLSEAQLKRLTKGYHLSVKDDVNYYCKMEAEIGSRLSKRQCYTVEQLADLERTRKDNQQRLERRQTQNPTSGT
jgi:hypothetical protein